MRSRNHIDHTNKLVTTTMERNAMTSDEILILEQRKDRAAARKRQREAQKLYSPEKYNQAKLNNRLSTAKYAKRKRVHCQKTMSGDEITVDKQLKAVSRWKQRQRRRMQYFGLSVTQNEGTATFVDEKCSSG